MVVGVVNNIIVDHFILCHKPFHVILIGSFGVLLQYELVALACKYVLDRPYCIYSALGEIEC